MKHCHSTTPKMPPGASTAVLSAVILALSLGLTRSHSQTPATEFPATDKISLDILAAALEDAVLDNIRITKELEALRARDNALGIALFSPSHSEIQERAIELLRQNADLKKQNKQLTSTLEQLAIHLQNTGAANIKVLDALQNIRPAPPTQKHFLAGIDSPVSASSPVHIEIIAQDTSNGWFIANAGWDNGLIEGMIYSFENRAGEKGQLRVIETRRHVSALIPQMGGSYPAIGQKLTLQTR